MERSFRGESAEWEADGAGRSRQREMQTGDRGPPVEREPAHDVRTARTRSSDRGGGTVVIVDPGFDHPHSHHPTVNLGLVRGLRKRGLRHRLLVSAAMSAELQEQLQREAVDAVPYFTTPTYPPGVEFLSVEEHTRLARRFADELEEAVRRGALPPRASLVLHTVYAFHVSGLAQALYRIPAGYVEAVYLALMFDPGVAPAKVGVEDVFAADRFLKYRTALNLLNEVAVRRQISLGVETSCEAYRRAYTRIAPDLDVRVHPIITFDGRPLKAPGPVQERILLYLGGVKEDKGIRFAIAIAQRLLESHPDLNLVFHFNSAFPGAQHFQNAVDDLRARGGTIEIIEGSLSGQAYQALIAGVTTLCVLYDPEHYAFKTSGVLWDGLRNPRLKWVVSADSWMETELQYLGYPHASVAYGDVAGAAEVIAATAREPAGRGVARAPQQRAYAALLRRSFGKHVAERLAALADAALPAADVPTAEPGQERVLVVRTTFPHFSDLSGPGGFIEHLRSKVARLDEVFVPLGESELRAGEESIGALWNATHRYNTAYQLNAICVEQQIVDTLWNAYDVIHFLDAEHAGLLTALVAARSAQWKSGRGPKLVATFHQPESLLRELFPDPSFLAGFDVIHVLAPSQEAYFREWSEAEVVCIPHGIAPALIERYIEGPRRFGESGRRFTESTRIILTTGNWLRDFPTLLATARLLQERADLQFVVVSNGLTFDEELPPNVQLVNQGISDAELHGYYRRAAALFLPLHDGAANNALLEGMLHGLPIVTTDLPATRFYTAERARYCPPDAAAYAQSLVAILDGEHADTQALQQQARSLDWRKVADRMLAELYRPNRPWEDEMKRIADLEHFNADLRAQIDRLTAERSALGSTVDEGRGAIERLTAERDALQRRAGEREERLAALTAQRDGLSQQLAQCREALDRQTAIGDERAQELTALCAARDELAAEVDRQRVELEALTTREEELRCRSTQLERDCEAMQTQRSESVHRQAVLEQELLKAEAQLELIKEVLFADNAVPDAAPRPSEGQHVGHG